MPLISVLKKLKAELSANASSRILYCKVTMRVKCDIGKTKHKLPISYEDKCVF